MKAYYKMLERKVIYKKHLKSHFIVVQKILKTIVIDRNYGFTTTSLRFYRNKKLKL